MKVSTPLFQLKILVDEKLVQEYHKDSNTFIEGRQGSAFMLKIHNPTHCRLLVHPSVDGLSVMTGEEASSIDSSCGYVLPGESTVRVTGWRLNNQEVAQFCFTGHEESYAAKSGKGVNPGVIACAVWEEAMSPRISSTSFLCDTSDGIGTGQPVPHYSMNFCSANAGVTEEKTRGNLGTGFGTKLSQHVETTSFIPAQTAPSSVAVIYYDDAVGLAKRGIQVRNQTNHAVSTQLPNPFPKDVGCKPPSDWQG